MREDTRVRPDLIQYYKQGISGKELHRHSDRYLGGRLPCQQGGECPYMERLDFEPRDYPVLIGNYVQAYNEAIIEDRYVGIDEFPDDSFLFEPTHNEATRAITNYLEKESDLPFSNWKELSRNRFLPQYADEIQSWKKSMGFYSHLDTRVGSQRSPDYHALAPLLTLAGLEFDLLENEWEYASLSANCTAVRSPEDEWSVLRPPRLYKAESVVALDGTPTLTKWRLALGSWIEHEPVLRSDSERRRYIRDVLGLSIIQTDAGTKPYSNEKRVFVASDGALLEGIYEAHGQRPSVITSKAALGKYEQEGLDALIKDREHYGNLKGSNTFSEKRLGAVIGSPHPPEDDAVERWAALDGESVARKTDEDGNELRGVDLDFGPLGNALFQDVVEYEVLQAVMRFGREADAETGEKGATVYVHTARLPYWVWPSRQVSVNTWSEGMHQVVSAIKESEAWPNGEWTNKEIAAYTSIGIRQVSKLMKELADEAYVDYTRGGRGNAYLWSNSRLEEFSRYGQLT